MHDASANHALLRTESATAMPARLLHVITGLGQGGAETMLVNLAVRFAAMGIQQQVVDLLAGGTQADRLRTAGIPVHELRMAPGRPSLSALWRLSRLIRSVRPQLVQSWMYHADLLAWGACALLPASLRPQLAWGLRCSDMRPELYSRRLRWVIGACAKLSRRPDLIIANSEAGAAVHRSLGYHAERLVVVPNGVDTARFRPNPARRAAGRRALGLAEDALVVALVARVDPMKDHRTFLEAMALSPDLRAVLVGRGTEALTLPPNVTALGARSDVEVLLPAFDVIALSSAFGEGFPNALAEGMATGLVPAVTDVGDCRHIVGAAGHVVPPSDPARLADALACAAADARAGKGEAARGRIVETFAMDRSVAGFLDAYASIVPAPLS